VPFKLISLLGEMTPLYVPLYLGFDDPREVARALVAWRFGLCVDEVNLLEQVATGLTNNEIADRLALVDENTIKNRIHNLYNKLGVKNRSLATRIATEFGICEAKVLFGPPKGSGGQTNY
jgi:DNA-binding CsgD family transcriptional regulator